MSDPFRIIIFRFFSPLRIIEIISLLSLIPIFKFEWQSAVFIFNGFFFIIAGSIIYEAVWDKEGFRKGIKKTSWKYYTGISMQFVGIAIFALSSFNIKPENFPTIVYYSLLVVGIGGALEAFHVFRTKKLKDIQLTPIQQVLAIIGFTILLLILSLYSYFEVLPRSGWF